MATARTDAEKENGKMLAKSLVELVDQLPKVYATCHRNCGGVGRASHTVNANVLCVALKEILKNEEGTKIEIQQFVNKLQQEFFDNKKKGVVDVIGTLNEAPKKHHFRRVIGCILKTVYEKPSDFLIPEPDKNKQGFENFKTLWMPDSFGEAYSPKEQKQGGARYASFDSLLFKRNTQGQSVSGSEKHDLTDYVLLGNLLANVRDCAKRCVEKSVVNKKGTPPPSPKGPK